MVEPYYQDEAITIFHGNSLDVLKELPSESVHCCVTSPPYWGLRDYGCNGQLGLEKTPAEYIANMVEIFRMVRELLTDDGTLWLNIGDSYASGKGTCFNPGGGCSSIGKDRKEAGAHPLDRGNKSDLEAVGLKPKDLVGIPWMVAFALRADGWYLRQDIIWSKPNPMPESVTDRCTKSHEYIFLLSKSPRYYYDQEAIKEPIKDTSVARLIQDVESQAGSERVPGKTNGNMKAVKFGGNKQCPDTRLQSGKEWHPLCAGGSPASQGHSGYFNVDGTARGGIMANKKSVWTVTTKGYKEAHFATFPPELIIPCIKAGCPEGGIVLDPFFGSGTTGEVCRKLSRKCIGIELNEAYIEDLAIKRFAQGVLL
jgi:DNA modification methylase